MAGQRVRSRRSGPSDGAADAGPSICATHPRQQPGMQCAGHGDPQAPSCRPGFHTASRPRRQCRHRRPCRRRGRTGPDPAERAKAAGRRGRRLPMRVPVLRAGRTRRRLPPAPNISERQISPASGRSVDRRQPPAARGPRRETVFRQPGQERCATSGRSARAPAPDRHRSTPAALRRRWPIHRHPPATRCPARSSTPAGGGNHPAGGIGQHDRRLAQAGDIGGPEHSSVPSRPAHGMATNQQSSSSTTVSPLLSRKRDVRADRAWLRYGGHADWREPVGRLLSQQPDAPEAPGHHRPHRSDPSVADNQRQQCLQAAINHSRVKQVARRRGDPHSRAATPPRRASHPNRYTRVTIWNAGPYSRCSVRARA